MHEKINDLTDRLSMDDTGLPPHLWSLHAFTPGTGPLELAAIRAHARGSSDRSLRAYAEVNDGRWIVRCPFCPSAQLAHRDDRLFQCVGTDPRTGATLGCLNERNGGHPVEVVWPAHVEEAEKVLLARPQEARNWLPHRGETVEFLKRENHERRARV